MRDILAYLGGGCFIIALLFLLHLPVAEAITEHTVLTPTLLQERLNAPILNEGVSTIDLSHLVIDLTETNEEFRDQFYQELSHKLNRSPQPLGLNFSYSLIQGEFIASRFGLGVSLTKSALPSLLTSTEKEQLQRDIRFVSEAGEQILSVTVFRGPLILHATKFSGIVNFPKSFFLSLVEASEVTFLQEANWSNTYFSKIAEFSGAVFNRDLNFSQSNFLGKAKFNQGQFRGIANFSSSTFQGGGDFQQSEFSQLANWSSSEWEQRGNFSQVNWRDRVLFSKSNFLESLSFTNNTFEKVTAFRSTLFNGEVDFQDVKLLDQIDFSNAIFSPNASINVAGLAFDSEQAKILGNSGTIGKVIFLPSLEKNEVVIRNLVLNFRRLEQIADANQIEYKGQQLRLQQLSKTLINTPFMSIFSLHWMQAAYQWLGLSLLLLLSNYGTNSNLVLGVGILAFAYFGVLFWLIDRWRRRIPQPILPNRKEISWMLGSFIILTLVGIANIFATADLPWLTLTCLGFIVIPMPLFLLVKLYQQGRYHKLMDSSYFLLDGSMRQLRLLLVRLPVIPEFSFFRDRYTPLPWKRSWNWLNYYDFSLNNLIKLGFNDIRLRDEHLPGIISTLVWYQWSLGLLYIVLLLWTLSRTIPGLNLLIYLK